MELEPLAFEFIPARKMNVILISISYSISVITRVITEILIEIEYRNFYIYTLHHVMQVMQKCKSNAKEVTTSYNLKMFRKV